MKYLFPRGHKINVGRKLSKKTRMLMSERAKSLGFGKWMTGRKMSEDVKEKISKKSLGKIKSPGTIEKLRISNTGKKRSDVQKKRLSDIHKRIGDKPPSRRGCRPWNYAGKTKLQESIRKSFEYRQWRSDVFTRDNFSCIRCNTKGNINADHIKEFATILKEYKIKSLPDAVACEELWNINNGRTLCVPCHKSRKQWDK